MSYQQAPPHILKLLTRSLFCWQISTFEKKIYLTFDDGPVSGITEKVLEILADYQAVATFFVLGENAEKHPEMLEAIAGGGHGIGSHGHRHLNGWKVSCKDYIKNVECFNISAKPLLFRPPYGRITPAQVWQLKNRGYQIIMWSLLSGDYIPDLDLEAAFKKIVKLTQPGSILVFHDSAAAAANCLVLLPKVIEHFAARGFSFETFNQSSTGLVAAQQNNDIFVPANFPSENHS